MTGFWLEIFYVSRRFVNSTLNFMTSFMAKDTQKIAIISTDFIPRKLLFAALDGLVLCRAHFT